MTTEQAWQAATAVACLLALLALVLALRAGARASRAERRSRDLADLVAEGLAVRESPVTSAPQARVDGQAEEQSTFVITGLGTEGADGAQAPVARDIDGRLFTDIVARETVVKAASWTHGLRRALSAESRNRIRFEVRQETRRAGRERRAEMKQALREFRARERTDVREDVA